MKLSTITGLLLWSYGIFTVGDTCRNLINYNITDWIRIWGSVSNVIELLLSLLMLLVGTAFILKNKFTALKGGIFLVVLLFLAWCFSVIKYSMHIQNFKDVLSLSLDLVRPLLEIIIIYYLIHHPLNRSELEAAQPKDESVLDM